VKLRAEKLTAEEKEWLGRAVVYFGWVAADLARKYSLRPGSELGVTYVTCVRTVTLP
jgi:hypothetical protein